MFLRKEVIERLPLSGTGSEQPLLQIPPLVHLEYECMNPITIAEFLDVHWTSDSLGDLADLTAE